MTEIINGPEPVYILDIETRDSIKRIEVCARLSVNVLAVFVILYFSEQIKEDVASIAGQRNALLAGAAVTLIGAVQLWLFNRNLRRGRE